MNENFESFYVVGTRSGKGVIYALTELGYKNSEEWTGEGYMGDTIYFTKPDMTIGRVVSGENCELYTYITDTGTEVKPKRWRAKAYFPYYYIDTAFKVSETTDERYTTDVERYEIGNYFETELEAQAIADKLKEFFNKERGIEDGNQ